MPPTSMQNSAPGTKSAKFIQANPLDPLLRPFDDDAVSEQQRDAQQELANNVNTRLEKAMEDLKEKHRTGRNEIDHPDRAPTGLPYHLAATSQQQQRRMQQEQQQQQQQQQQLEGDSDQEYDAWLDDMQDDPAVEAIRQERMQELKKQQAKKAANIAKGHGTYRNITQDEFLPECTSSEYVVVHFYHNDFEQCEIMHHHLQKVAPKHLNCKFLKIDAQKAPFFVAKLAVRTMPSLLVFKDGKTIQRLLGFQDLAPNPDKPKEFPTSRLEKWLSKATEGAIEYAQDPDELHEDMERLRVRSNKVVYRGGIQVYDENL